MADERKPDPATTDNNAGDRIWRYLEFVSNLHAGRVNFFLVAESMLLVATFTIQDSAWIGGAYRFLMCVTGAIYTFAWWYTNARLQKRIDLFNRELKSTDDVYRRFLESTDMGQTITSGWLISHVLPCATLVLWGLLLFLQFLK